MFPKNGYGKPYRLPAQSAATTEQARLTVSFLRIEAMACLSEEVGMFMRCKEHVRCGYTFYFVNLVGIYEARRQPGLLRWVNSILINHKIFLKLRINSLGKGKSSRHYFLLYGMEGIKNIIFDMGGVLIDLDRETCIEEFRKLGFPEADEMLNTYRQKGIFKDLEMGTVSPQELYDYISSEVGHHIPSEKIDKALCAFLVGLPTYKLDMLLHLRKQYRVFMLSNTNALMMPYIARTYFTQQGLTVEDYFDRLFLSYEMGMLKPDPEIFEAVLNETGIKAEETLFIDDAEPNIETALSLGFRTYLAAPKEDFRRIFE